MKIGILTFHFVRNYGAIVQTYALKNALEENSHEVEVIDYRPFVRNRKYLTQGWGIKSRKLKEFNLPQIIKNKFLENIKCRKIEDFRNKYLGLSPYFKDLIELKKHINKYDAIIVGSDQVWNSNFSLETYLLHFIKDNTNVKKISYAACVGSDKSFDEVDEDVLNSIKKFDLVSVRNKFSYDLVYKKTGIKPEIVCDPTLLIDWKKHFTDSKRIIPYDYIFIYGYPYNNEEIVAFVKKELNLPVVSVGMEYEYYFSQSDKIISDAGPIEWLNLIKHSSFVITKSFHGMMMSLKYKKQFLITNNPPPKHLRLFNAAKQFGVEKRIVDSFNEQEMKKIVDKHIDYVQVEKALNQNIIKSENFLKKGLEND